jgi:hypothetical protein
MVTRPDYITVFLSMLRLLGVSRYRILAFGVLVNEDRLRGKIASTDNINNHENFLSNLKSS